VDGRTIIFCQTKKECNELALDAQVSRAGGGTKELHGDIPQGQREKTMQAFRDGKVRALIATDVAARGLDVKGKYFKRKRASIANGSTVVDISITPPSFKHSKHVFFNPINIFDFFYHTLFTVL